jgi:hypothetical protein
VKTIYKYPLGAKTVNYIELPKGAEVISVQEQRGGVNVYALVDNEIEETETFEVLMYGTGHKVTERIDDYKFLGTVSMYGGDLVFHIFAEKVTNTD